MIVSPSWSHLILGVISWLVCETAPHLHTPSSLAFNMAPISCPPGQKNHTCKLNLHEPRSINQGHDCDVSRRTDIAIRQTCPSIRCPSLGVCISSTSLTFDLWVRTRYQYTRERLSHMRNRAWLILGHCTNGGYRQWFLPYLSLTSQGPHSNLRSKFHIKDERPWSTKAHFTQLLRYHIWDLF